MIQLSDTTGGHSGIAQTVLVAMPTVCPPLQSYAAAELATYIFSQPFFVMAGSCDWAELCDS